MPYPSHRNTIFVEDAEVLTHEAFADKQFVLRVRAPQCAAKAQPGSFVHIQCDPSLPMRRPLSIMRANARQGTVEILYKCVGPGLELLAQKKTGALVSVMGPIGQGFVRALC
jgi:dihydroorotate dehydrogenase electron transfer subunit